MTPEPVTLKITEDALEELITTYARHTATAVGRSRDRPRHRVGLDRDAASADRAACWLRMVSIVEIYTEALLRHLADEAPGRAPGGWSDVIGLLRRRHNIDVADIPAWERLEACLLVRNAVAHGLGRFTAKQLEKETPRKIRVIGVPVRDGMVVITATSLADCVETCREFITKLDTHPQVTAEAITAPAAADTWAQRLSHFHPDGAGQRPGEAGSRSR
ncbi:hypothetical protein GCM10027280_60680 [Micromonospora polyrhachis]|uniref:RiboL-PSP-HEPN domain-containing protein n=1 Tax=Micromonospora polyrhachis TaxID=1282883 RepID=A0A7W7WQW6_9ACTN|nr:hypothetical protein [Micromonospora polyrhachis]MBB4960259.1 hypothetical protein [Micromonospora polyrhachis]